jgi:hypothetical protein
VELARACRDVFGRVWSKAARRRQRPDEGWEETRLEWVREHAPGHSFCDVGGLFKYMGDIAFLAERVGATQVTLVDVGDPDLIAAGHPEWGWLEDKVKDLGSSLRYVQGDLEDACTPERVGVHDVVFFSGVLYHTPNPMQQLTQLRAITGELAYISTLTMPEVPGFPQACVFYPLLDEADRKRYAAGYHWANDLLAIGAPFDERPMYGYGNCWWGMTPSALRAMLQTARFEVVEERHPPVHPFMTDFVVRPLPIDPSLPPLSYFRERGEMLAAGKPRPPFDTWYDELRN